MNRSRQRKNILLPILLEVFLFLGVFNSGYIEGANSIVFPADFIMSTTSFATNWPSAFLQTETKKTLQSLYRVRIEYGKSNMLRGTKILCLITTFRK